MSFEIMDVETEERAYEFYEYGTKFNYKAVKFRLFRDVVVQFLCKGLVEEALGKGFKIKDKKSKDDVEKLQPVLDIIMRYNAENINAYSYDRGFAHGLLSFTTIKDKDKVTDIFIKSHLPESYQYGYNKKTGKYVRALIDFSFVELTGEDKSAVSKINTEQKRQPFTDENSIHILTNQGDTIGRGKAWIESVWDDAFGIYVTGEQGTYYVIKNGSGVSVYKIPEADMDGGVREAKILKRIKETNAPHSTKIIVISSDPEAPQPDIVQQAEQQINFAEIMDMYWDKIALRSNVPKARLKGLEPGQQEGATVNQASYFDVLEKIQQTYKQYYLEEIELIAGFLSIEVDIDSIDLEYNVRKSLTDIEKAQLFSTRLDNMTKGLLIHKQMGLTLEKLKEMSELDYEIEQTLVDEADAEKQEMKDAFDKGSEEGEEEDKDPINKPKINEEDNKNKK